MVLGLTVAGAGTALLALLMLLFRVEESQGRRIILGGVRNFLDRVVLYVAFIFSRFLSLVGIGVLHDVLHTALQKILNGVIRILTHIETRLLKIQRRNRVIAEKVRNENEASHLSQIATYKEEMALSEAEKRKRRMH